MLVGIWFQSVRAEKLNRRTAYRVRALGTTRKSVPADWKRIFEAGMPERSLCEKPEFATRT
jgi:hypothetical protein